MLFSTVQKSRGEIYSEGSDSEMETGEGKPKKKRKKQRSDDEGDSEGKPKAKKRRSVTKIMSSLSKVTCVCVM